MRKLMFMLMFVLLIPGLPLFGGENILENPGFETGVLDPWEGRGGSADVVTDPVDAGSYAGRAFDRSQGWHSIAQDVLGKMIAGETYTTGAWVRTNSATPYRVNLAFVLTIEGQSESYPWVGSNDNVDNTEWVFITDTYEMPENVIAISFYVESGDSTVEIYVDDAYVGIGEYERPGAAPRGAATDPVPSDGASMVYSQTTSAVTWTAPSDPCLVSVDGYDVYFGTDPNAGDNPVTSVITESLPVTLGYATTYYWRVDPNVVWTTGPELVEGQPWSFTTLAADSDPYIIPGSDVLTSLEFLPASLTGTVVAHQGEDDIASIAWEVIGTNAPNTGMQMVTRTSETALANLAEIATDPNLLMDWIGTDTREALADPLVLTLKGLPADTYDWKSYHHDPDATTMGLFDATIIDASGPAVITDIDISDSNSTPATFETTIVSDGSDVVLFFDQQPYVGEGYNDAWFVMNGFELTDIGETDSLYIDFSDSTQGSSIPMPGYEAYDAEHEVAETFTEQSYSAFSATVSILPTWGGVATVTDTTNDPCSSSQTATLDTDWPGSYIVQLSATDKTAHTGSATMDVRVEADACAAAQVASSWTGFDDNDFNSDCLVTLEDFASFAAEWLDDLRLTEPVEL